jgi:hypothetical protein
MTADTEQRPSSPQFFKMLCEAKNSSALLQLAMKSLAAVPPSKERHEAAQAALDRIMRDPGELEAAALTEAGAMALGGLLEVRGTTGQMGYVVTYTP